MKNFKFQIANSKQITMTKYSNERIEQWRVSDKLEFGILSLFVIWNLEFGDF